jgi:hypothetical protein
MKIENCIDPFTCINGAGEQLEISIDNCIVPNEDDLRECFAQRCADSACYEELPAWTPELNDDGEPVGKPYNTCTCSWAGSLAKEDGSCMPKIEITEAGAANCTGTFVNATDPPTSWANAKGCTLTKGPIPNDPETDETRNGWVLTLESEPVYWIGSEAKCPPAALNEDEAWSFGVISGDGSSSSSVKWESDDAEPMPVVSIGSMDFRCVRAPVGSHAPVLAFLLAFAAL